MRPRSLLLLLTAFVLALAALLLAAPWLRRERVSFVANSNPAAAAVSGTVVGPDGLPLGGVTVMWYSADAPAAFVGMARPFAGGATVVTAADGTFRFDDLPAVDGFAALAGDRPRYEGQTGELTPQRGSVAVSLQLQAAPIPPSRLLTGRLRDPGGAPMAFVQVESKASSWFRNWQMSTVTDAEGRFELRCPWPTDDATLTWQPQGGVAQPLGQIAFGQHVDLRVERPR
jgi:hypothetical protein